MPNIILAAKTETSRLKAQCDVGRRCNEPYKDTDEGSDWICCVGCGNWYHLIIYLSTIFKVPHQKGIAAQGMLDPTSDVNRTD